MKRTTSFAAVLLLLSLASVAPVRASATENPCAMQDGYVADIPFGDESGIGGTGYTGGDEDKGIGGTGARVVQVTGTVYAFGSICVNGLRIDTDRTDVPLRLGQVVEVEAVTKDGGKTFSAQEVEVEYPLEGPVTGFDPSAGTLEVMEENISLARFSSVPAVTAGQLARVSGLRDATGRIEATYISVSPGISGGQSVPGRVNGYLRGNGDGSYRIGGVPVSFGNPAEMLPLHANVEARGIWNGQTLVVSGIELYEPEETAAIFSTEGYIEDLGKESPDQARICEQDFSVARLQDKIVAGARVIVTGMSGADGKAVARALRFPPLPPAFFELLAE